MEFKKNEKYPRAVYRNSAGRLLSLISVLPDESTFMVEAYAHLSFEPTTTKEQRTVRLQMAAFYQHELFNAYAQFTVTSPKRCKVTRCRKDWVDLER